MLTRIITGVVLGPLVAWLLLEGPVEGIAVLFVAAAATCMYELLAMAMPEHRLARWGGVFLAAAILTWFYLAPDAILLQAIAFLLVPALLVLARPAPLESAALRLGVLWGSFVYLVLPFSFGLELATRYEPMAILMLLVLVFAGDTFAYFGGRAFGRHKLYPQVSPNKTIEGAVSGLLASVGAAMLVTALWMPSVGPLRAALIGLAGGAVAQLGDLAESLIKRACGVKDSGHVLPGHGGMLDRLDGVIFALPVVHALLVLV